MNHFKHNMGRTDRVIRVVLGVLLIGNVFLALQHPIGWIGSCGTGMYRRFRRLKGVENEGTGNRVFRLRADYGQEGRY